MGTLSRLRDIIAANVNALLEKAEDPGKLLRALVREMEDAGEEARLACASLLAEEQRLERIDRQLADDAEGWESRAAEAVAQGRDDLARAAIRSRQEIAQRRRAIADERGRVQERLQQMEQDMETLKAKLADAKRKLKDMQIKTRGRPAQGVALPPASPGERKARRALERFERLQGQVENLEARVRSYDVGGPAEAVWNAGAAAPLDPAVEAELTALKERLAQRPPVAEEGSA